VELRGELRPRVAASAELAASADAVPLAAALPEVRALGRELHISGERVPLVLEASEDGPFRVVVAVWAGPDGSEIVERAERLEALLGTWSGETIAESRWAEAHAVARDGAVAAVRTMQRRAAAEEHEALQRQVAAARRRLLRELARYLACAAESDEDFNAAFHRAMQRGGQVGALLVRAHGLLGYPLWTAAEVRAALDVAGRLTGNQRTNVLLGTPLEAAVRDPRWTAATTLKAISAPASVVGVGAPAT
jgi:hypothetical protein